MNNNTFYSEIAPTNKKVGVAFDTGEALKSVTSDQLPVTRFGMGIGSQEETYRLQRRRTLTSNDVREKNWLLVTGHWSLFEEFYPVISTHLLQQEASWDE